MYKCNNCEELFEEPETKNIVAEDYLGISHLFQTLSVIFILGVIIVKKSR